MYSRADALAKTDPDPWRAIQGAHQRQEDHVELIASENHAPPVALAVAGTQLTNKYAEGYPSRRCYSSRAHVDMVEQLAPDRAEQLFGAAAANVRRHCDASANADVLEHPSDEAALAEMRATGPDLTRRLPLYS